MSPSCCNASPVHKSIGFALPRQTRNCDGMLGLVCKPPAKSKTGPVGPAEMGEAYACSIGCAAFFLPLEEESTLLSSGSCS